MEKMIKYKTILKNKTLDEFTDVDEKRHLSKEELETHNKKEKNAPDKKQKR